MATESRIVIEPKSSAEQILYSTVRIAGDAGTGSGFFFRYLLEKNKGIEMILTNKHVVNGNRKLSLYFHEAISNGVNRTVSDQSILVEVGDRTGIWVEHPQHDVDLGALLFSPIRKHVKADLQKDIFNIFFDNTFIKDDGVLQVESDVAEDVLMAGYPIGLWDEINNFPIIRKGITAAHPALDFQGKSQGVVDIACFPGSSGSPILSYASGAYLDKKSQSFTIGGKVTLLGLLFGGPAYTSEGKIEIKEIPTQQIPVATSQQFIHLGYYVKAKEILVLCEHIKNNFIK